MIDKLDLRVPMSTPFASGFQFVAEEVMHAGTCSIVSRSKHYQGIIDLRRFGIPAMLHAYKRRAPKSHKLELFETGRKTSGEMAGIVTQVFDVDPNNLEIMRIDLAADIPDVTVEHFRNSLRMKFKRSIDERGEMEYANIGRRSVEYLRYGISPNCLRVYNKPAECWERYRHILKRHNLDADVPSFEELFGFPENAIMTRIERQCGGCRVPLELEKFSDLEGAANFNPFKSIAIVPEQFSFPSVEDYGVSERIKLIGIASLTDRVGRQQALSELNRDGNGKRLRQLYETHCHRSAHLSGLTVDRIIEAYRASTRRQVEKRG